MNFSKKKIIIINKYNFKLQLHNFTVCFLLLSLSCRAVIRFPYLPDLSILKYSVSARI